MPWHGAFLPEMSPRVFSFNNPLGACPNCQGLGVQESFPELVIDKTLQLKKDVFDLCDLNDVRVV